MFDAYKQTIGRDQMHKADKKYVDDLFEQLNAEVTGLTGRLSYVEDKTRAFDNSDEELSKVGD
jgi:hypothetical protein